MGQEFDLILDLWREQKALARDMLLLFRCGDFYETFGEDAQTLHDRAGTTLTVRRGLKLAGVPYHSVEAYIGRLVKAGIPVCPRMRIQRRSMCSGSTPRFLVRERRDRGVPV